METEVVNNNSNKENITENKNELEGKETFQKDKYKKKGEYPNFLLKLYQILENESYKDIIHWTEDGKYFIISNLHDFTEKILPKYYKHNNYSSFIRQLNMYDFHKKKSGQNEHVFHHQNFIRNRKDLLKLIKRKSKKENINTNNQNNDLAYNNQNNLLQLYKNPDKFRTILDQKIINSDKQPLSIDDDVNLSNSIHSLFSQNNNKNIFLPPELINASNNNINNENYNKQVNDDLLNDLKLVNNQINNGQKTKVTKNNLQNLLTNLTHEIDNDIEKEKVLESKIEQLSKQNEEFISQNKKILQEIIKKKEYNKKLEAVICFIFELLKPKSNNKFKNNTNYKNLIQTEKDSQNQSLINFSLPKNDVGDIISNNNFIQRGEVLEPFQEFINKYLGSNKNGLISNNNNFINKDYKYLYNFDKNQNNDSNSNNVKTLRRNLLCSGNEEQDNDKNPPSLIKKKRKRSGSLSSILSDISKESKESKIIYNNKPKNEGENEEKVEEKKYEEENLMPNVNVISEVNNESFDSLNKSKNVFDIDFPQEENKSFNNELSQDLLNNSYTTFNYMYNSNLNNNSDVFSDVNK